MHKIISLEKSIVVDCFVDFEFAHYLIKETTEISGIGGYKLDALKILRKGLENWIGMARNYTNKPLILDGQKWGTDIPETGESLMKDLKDLKTDALILFPLSGPVTQIKWTEYAQKVGLPVIIGGEMTHDGMKRSEGGYFMEEDFIRMYVLGVEMGIRNFVLPGNKPEQIKKYRSLIESTTKEEI